MSDIRNDQVQNQATPEQPAQKKPYARPELANLGSVKTQTQQGIGSQPVES